MRQLLFILACLFVFAQQAHGQGILQNPIQGPITASSTNCATQGDQSCLWMKLPTNAAVVSVTVSGTFSETLVAEYTGDSGAHWTTAATLTTAGLTSYVVAGMTDFRVRASAVVSGTALITIQASLAPSGGVTSGTGAPSGSCTANQIYVNQSNGNLYTCSAGSWVLSGGGGSGTVTNIATTGPITGGPITTTGTIACPTCTTSAAAITNNVLAKGSGGAQGLANSLATDDGTTLTYTGSGGFNSGGGYVAAASSLFSWTGRSSMQSTADGVLVLLNNAGTDFSRLVIGQTSASFPAICHSGTTLKVGLANAACTTLAPVNDSYTQPNLQSIAFSTTPAITWTTGQVAQFSCTTAASAVVPTFSGYVKGVDITVIFVQNGTTPCTWAWPTTVHGAVAVSVVLNSISVEKFMISNNGTDAYLESATVGTTGGTP